MRTAKSYKILTLVVVFMLSIVAAFSSMSFTGAKAASTASNPTSYFAGSAKLSFANDNLVAEMKEGNSFSAISRLIVDDLAFELNVDENVTEFEITFKSDAYYANGNMVVDGKKVSFVNSVENVLLIKLSNTSTEYSINDNTSVKTNAVSAVNGMRNLKVAVSVNADHILTASINGNGVVKANDRVDAVERIDKTTALVSFGVEKTATADQSCQVELISVDQKASDTTGAYKQTFELDADGALTDEALPRVTLDDKYFIKNLDNGKYEKLVMYKNVERSFTTNVYAVAHGVKISDVFVTSNESDAYTSNEKTPKKLAFCEVDDVKNSKTSAFAVAYKNKAGETVVIENYKATVIDDSTDTKAPVYIDDKQALDEYKAALQKTMYKEVLDSINGGQSGVLINASVSLGTSPDLPSLRDLVYDEYTPYGSLSFDLKYANDDNSSTTSSSMKFKITKAGNYEYYVMFKDKAGNAMEQDDFRVEDKEDANKYQDGKYSKYIFNFTVEDNAPIQIEKSKITGIAYKNIQFKGSKFKVEAEGCDTAYNLYYNPDKNADKGDEGWKLIPAASKVTKESYTDEYGNTYESVQAVGYDGEVTFTPTEYGSYMIECVATSDYTTRTDSDYTIVVVDEELSTPTFVKVPNYWLRDNVWSVVFLSVGTLSLIGIIVLLFIKPKDETESN